MYPLAEQTSSSRRRPWSPEPEQLPPPDFNYWHQSQQDYGLGTPPPPSNLPVLLRRQPSDPSVEAYDMADYSRTLRRPFSDPPNSNMSSPYPPLRPTAVYPQSYQPHEYDRDYFVAPRPFSSQSMASPPSLESSGSVYSQPSVDRIHTPPTALHHHPESMQSLTSIRTSFVAPRHPGPLANIHPDTSSDYDGDLSRFPPFSRTWFSPSDKPKLSPYVPSDLGVTTPRFPCTYEEYESDILPWGRSYSAQDSSRGGATNSDHLSPSVKEERLRMLEREFGKKPGHHHHQDDYDQPKVGDMDESGKLITEGPRKRVATRVMQILLALLTGASGIYGALFLKTRDVPPPKGQPPALILYFLSVITFIILLYLFLFRPCCSGRRKGDKYSSSDAFPGAPGMMVLPVQSFRGEKKSEKKKRKKGKKGEAPQTPGGDVQVNLIVDPSMFGGRSKRRDSESEYSSTEMETSSDRRQNFPRRRGVLEGLAMAEHWKAARVMLRRLFYVDMAFLLIWSAEFVYVMIGKRCPPGQFEGWCHSYNVATASTCLLAIAFGLSLFFDIKDLHQSRQNPRTRT